MGIGTIVAIYFIIWWLCLFAVLPFGIRSPAEAGSHDDAGLDPGAPVQPRLVRKMLVTTVIAIFVTGAILYIMRSGVIRLEDLPMPFKTNYE